MSNYNQFLEKLREIFMMNHAELDFGIYRIMNQKREEITKFLEKDLLPQVKKILGSNNSDAAKTLQQELDKAVKQCEALRIDPNTSMTVIELREQIAASSASNEELENEVFNHLTIFFSRYYDNGDFVSKRRYKDNAYAIPYNGEEVKLHWANNDQYYIKTSEYFQNYTFNVLLDDNTKKKVHFVLKDVSTEQNNNKAASGMERRFALYQDEEAASVEVIRNEDGEEELNIYFTYELMAKGTKQDALMAAAFDSIKTQLPADFSVLITTLCPTEKLKKRTLLEKHLTDYTAKNSFDYFIHKDLGGFLRRELDFYIKNEVLLIDDLDEKHVMQQLNQVRAIKGVGEKIITMLAQIEDFQKRLWLKKKFVVQSDYCITLDRVPESFYAEICENEAQRKEWVRLFAIDEIKGTDLSDKENLSLNDLFEAAQGYSEPLTEDFLRQNPYLVLDTALFSTSFKHRLLSKMGDVDKKCNGLLIQSDNRHALSLLTAKYKDCVSGVYIDPPYNTGSDGFVYKDNYLHSSWLAMMQERLLSAKILMKQSAPISISINENELFSLKGLMDTLFDGNYYSTLTVKVRHEDRILKGDKDFHEVYENLLFYSKNNLFKPLKRIKDNSSIEDYKYTIETKDADRIIELGDKLVEVYSPKNYEIIKNSTPSSEYLKPISVRGSIREGNSSGRFYVAYLEELAKDFPGYLFKVPQMGDDKYGYRYFWTPSVESGRKNGDYYQGKPIKGKDILEIPYPNYIDFEKAFNDATNEGGVAYRNGKKPLEFMKYVLSLQKIMEDKNSLVLDYFAGSATTGHTVLNFNKEDNGNRMYLLCQVGDIFDEITKKRMSRSIYSEDWKDGKPVSRKGISQCFKYIRLEQYEDTLNNLEVKKKGDLFGSNEDFHESYMLQYMMDMETRDSLFNIDRFVHPFDVKLKTTRDNELVETTVDMVETFNYLIGLEVDAIRWTHNDEICVVEGRLHRNQDKALIIWRDTEKVNNAELNDFFRRNDYHVKDSEFDVIYVNGDNTLQNQKRDDEHWKVVLIEEEFQEKMFEGDK